jgi:hypothetical protein
MADLTKQQLTALNNANFPNNNSAFITPEKLRTFNQDMIDSIALDVSASFSGPVTVDGTVTATHFVGDGSGITGVTSEVPQGTVSGSSQVIYEDISDIPSGIVSGSSQVSYNGITDVPSGLVSGSSQISDITGSSLVTASFASQTLTFTKGDGSTFGIVIPDESGSVIPSGTISGSSQVDYPLISNIPSGIISSSQQLPAGLVSGSSQLTSSYDIRYQLSGSDAPLPSGVVSGSSQVSYIGLSNIPSGIISSSQQLPAGLVSGSSQVSSITGSSLVTASFASQTLTFTKGDGTTFGVNIPDVSGSDITALNAFTSSQELLNGTFATTGSNTFIGNFVKQFATTGSNTFIGNQDITGDILTNGNTNLFANNNDTSPLLVETQNGAKLKVYTKNEEDASEIAVEFYGNTFTDGYVSAQSLQAEPGDADTFPLEVTDGIAPRIIVNSQNEASSSGRNIDITGNTRIISTATNKIGAISISYANPSGANAALSIGADNFNTAKSKVDFNASEMKFGTDGGVSSRVAFGDPSSTDQIDFSTSGSSQMLKLESSGYLIVSGNINMAPNTAIVGGLFESTGEMATPLLLVDTIEPNTDTKVSITAVINLGAQDPLPAGAIGDLSVSGSALYFYDGAWKTVSLV